MTPIAAPDDLERLRAADPLPDRATQGVSPEVILARILRQVPDAPGRPASNERLLSRRRLVPVASVTTALLATTTVGYAVLQGGESPSIGCVSGDAVVEINAVSSDPVADCAARLAADGVPVDPHTLTTFMTEDGSVIVASDETAAEGVVVGDLSPVPGLRSETDLVELRMAMDDVVTGVGDCSDTETVSERARSIADRLGFAHWDVVERNRPNGNHCGWAFADLDGQRIVVVYEPDSPKDASTGAVTSGTDGRPTPVPDAFLDMDEDADASMSSRVEIITVSQAIHDAVSQDCLSAVDAEEMARDAVVGSSLADTAQITVNEDPNASCARVYTNAYGGYEITVFGP
ncbi:hypothetical protein FTX61_21465 [Nitriliruptoraceae bacterium ZYF776]|nr:hypothetical protein [Profundirhabdus halotolerans]